MELQAQWPRHAMHAATKPSSSHTLPSKPPTQNFKAQESHFPSQTQATHCLPREQGRAPNLKRPRPRLRLKSSSSKASSRQHKQTQTHSQQELCTWVLFRDQAMVLLQAGPLCHRFFSLSLTAVTGLGILHLQGKGETCPSRPRRWPSAGPGKHLSQQQHEKNEGLHSKQEVLHLHLGEQGFHGRFGWAS